MSFLHVKPPTNLILLIRWLYCVECHNTVLGSKRSVICAQAVYFLHSTMQCHVLRLSDVSVVCRVTNFQFLIQVCFSSMSAATPHSGVDLPNIGRCRKLGSVSCTTHGMILY